MASKWTAHCVNSQCSEHGVPKPSNGVTLAEGERVICGACGQPCAVTEIEEATT